MFELLNHKTAEFRKMWCHRCGDRNCIKLYEVYHRVEGDRVGCDWRGQYRYGTSSRSGDVCSNCLKGYNIPVKKSNGKMSFGVVKDFAFGTHRIQFIDGSIERVLVDEKPFQKYCEELNNFSSKKTSMSRMDTEVYPYNPSTDVVNRDKQISAMKTDFFNFNLREEKFGISEDDLMRRLTELVSKRKQPKIAYGNENARTNLCRYPCGMMRLDQIGVDRMNIVVQDALLIQLHDLYGCEWNEISKIMGIDNVQSRFEEIDRRVERDLREVVEFYGKQIISPSSSGQVSFQVRTVLPFLVKISIKGSVPKPFGSLRNASQKGEQCARCGLYCPSYFTGNRICSSTKWCEACTKIPIYICGDTLHRALFFRKQIKLSTSELHSKTTTSV